MNAVIISAIVIISIIGIGIVAKNWSDIIRAEEIAIKHREYP